MLTPTHRRILRSLNSSGPLTRADLGAELALSKAAMSGLTRDLIDGDLVEETTSVQRQGRPAVLLDLRADGAYFLGVSLLSSPAQLALTDLKGNILAKAALDFDPDPERFAGNVAAAVPALTTQVPRERLAGIGIALSGLVDEEQARCIKSTLLGWQDVPLANLIRKRLDLPTFVENDARALALSEKHFGEAREFHNFTVISLGEGIGSAHFIHNRLYRGAHGGAGEIAHCTIEPEGRPCRCGKVGCVDAVASLMALTEMAREEGLEATTLAQLEQAATAGSSAAIRILHRAGGALGRAIATVIQINDPQTILIAHQEKSFTGLFATVMQQSVEANVLPRLSGRTPIRTKRVDNDVWSRGAASVVANSFLNGLI